MKTRHYLAAANRTANDSVKVNGMLLFDLRDALRGLFRDRAYSLAAVVTFALGIGATTSVFSIVNGVLLKPLPYGDPGRLVSVTEIWRQFSDRYPTVPVNERHFEYWRAHAKSFAGLAEFVSLPANLTGVGDATEITVVHTSSSLFDVLQERPSVGRALIAADERAGGPLVAVLADRLWSEKFERDPAVVGRTVTLDGKVYSVVGVMPPAFRVPRNGQLSAKVDAFIPLRVEEDHVGWVGEHNETAIARLQPGVTIERARTELDALQAQISMLATTEAHETVTLASHVTSLADSIVGDARRGLLLLLAAVAAVLLIACSNLANLSLTRTLAHARDAAIRTALGAGRARLISRLAIEHLALAAAGGGAGLLVAYASLVAFVRTAPIDLPRVAEVSLDGRVIAVSAALTLVSALLVAIAPAWHLAGADVHDKLRGGLNATDTPARLRTRGVLVLVQIGVSVSLLVMTSLLMLSFVRLLRSDPGFRPQQTLAIDVAIPLTRYSEPARRAQLADRVLSAVTSIAGVTSAAWAHMLPLTGQATVNFLGREEDPRPLTQQPPANYRYVSADYFKTLSIPLERGHVFLDVDQNRATIPAVVTERTAARIWPDVDPIGQRFRWSPDQSEKPVEVVGVVADTKTNIDGTPPLMVYMPYWYRPRPSASLVVHAGAELSSLTSTVRQAIRSIDPDIAVAAVRPMEAIVDEALAGRRYQMWLFVAFGAMALVLATVGVYGVTAYGVSRRRREMNIRIALGASGGQVFSLVVTQAMMPVAAGILLGIVAAAATSSVVASLLFEVSARDPRVIAMVAVAVAVVGAGAAMAAAAQGLELNPAAALRAE